MPMSLSLEGRETTDPSLAHGFAARDRLWEQIALALDSNSAAEQLLTLHELLSFTEPQFLP